MKAIFLDLETTGLDFKKHTVVDVAVKAVNLHDNTELFTYNSLIKCFECEIKDADKEAMKVNGLTYEKLREGKHLIQVKYELQDLLVEHGLFHEHAVFICQNPSFDRPFFQQIIDQEETKELKLPYHWLDLASMYWIKFYGSCYPTPIRISLSKDSIAKSFGIPPEEKPHSALRGVEHLIQCYYAVSHNMICNPTEPVIYQDFLPF